MVDSKSQPLFGYQSVNPTPEQQNSEDEKLRPRIELGDHPQLAKKRGWMATAMWQAFALLWLVPVIALMYLNFTEYVIGASAWCPAGHCWLNTFNPIQAIPRERGKKFDKESHDLIGGLQFVAKGLEIWFGIIAAAVMYLVTMKTAGKKEGLPIGYISRPMEFADPITLLDPLLWKTGPSPFGVNKSEGDKRVGRRVWYLIALSIFLCVLINLMGPATAVLVIPALQWIEMPKVGGRIFNQMEASQPLQTTSDTWLWYYAKEYGCREAQIQAQNYTCMGYHIGDSMDAWMSSYLAIQAGGVTTQDGAAFGINSTQLAKTSNSYDLVQKQVFQNKQQYYNFMWWVPNRQVIAQLVSDYGFIKLLSLGFTPEYINANNQAFFQPNGIDTYVEYNKSLELTVVRNGPILGTIPNMWSNYNGTGLSVIQVDGNRQIRCYANYDLSLSPLAESTAHGNYTKCIRTGSGWSSENKMTKFYTLQVYNQDTDRNDPGVDITVWSSDKAAFFKDGVLPSWLPGACLTDGPVLNRTVCPWERMFTTDPSSDLFNRTQHVNTVEFYMANTTGASTKFVVDYVAFADFTSYSIDVNPVSNPSGYVSTGDLPSTAPAIHIDPTYYRMAWSVAEGDSVLSNRTSTGLLTALMQYKLQNPQFSWPSDYNHDYLALVPIFQTLSLIPFSTTPTHAKKSTDPAHPLLQRWAHMYVWAYGITSRTAELGIAVAIAGCLIVLWHFLLGFTDRRRYRSPTQLIVAALEHSPRGEFEGKGHDELSMARVRFHIKDNDSQVGKFSFYEPDAADASELVQRRS